MEQAAREHPRPRRPAPAAAAPQDRAQQPQPRRGRLSGYMQVNNPNCDHLRVMSGRGCRDGIYFTIYDIQFLESCNPWGGVAH